MIRYRSFLKTRPIAERRRVLSFGPARPSKATDVRGSAANAKIFVNFTPVVPPPDTYTIIATPSAGGTPISNPGQTPDTNPDGTMTAPTDTLTNGTAYDVTVVAVLNGVSSLPSDPTVDSVNIVPFGFDLTDLGSKYWADYDASHVTLSGGDITSINDFSGGSGPNVPYVSGTHATVNASVLNGIDAIRFTSDGFYHDTSSIAISTTARYWFTIFKNNSTGAGGALYRTTNEALGFLNEDTTFADVTTLNDGGTAGEIILNTGLIDMNRSVNHRVVTWKNGDQSVLAEANSGGITSPNVLVSIGSDDGSSFFNLSDFGRAIVIDGSLTDDQIQQVEGIAVWSFPLLHLNLPVTHPYRDVSPSGDVSIPDVPSIAYARPNGSGKISILIDPGDEGGAAVTYYALSSPGGFTASDDVLSFDMTGLSNGTAYTLTARSQNIAGSSVASSASPSATPSATSQDILTQWPLNESSGNALDSWYSLYDLTLAGTLAATTINGFAARDFNNSGDLSVGALSGLSRKLDELEQTVSFWINTLTGTGIQLGIIGNYGPGSLRGMLIALINGKLQAWKFTDGSTNNCIYDGSLGGVNTGTINDGNDHHVVFTFGAAGGDVYVDNVHIGSTVAWTGTPQATSGNTTATKIGIYNSNRLVAKLAKLKYASRKWDATDVAYDWNSGAGRDL